jgi:hypothetical protein
MNEWRKKMRIRIHLIILFLFVSTVSFPQQNAEEFSILFYNVENLFDTKDNPNAFDEEFTPNGDRYWTFKKLNTKLLNISKVILSSNGWVHPAIIALCEIENRDVLELLTKTTPLKSYDYKIIHKESPDHRGIDVAFLYDSNQFYPLSYKCIPVFGRKGIAEATREILYVSGLVNERDTMHFFVNHWPSRYSGLLETRTKRNAVAKLLRQKTQELFDANNSAKIVIVGDFNDSPSDESMMKNLKAMEINGNTLDTELYNLSFDWVDENEGTLKYQSQWSVFDQIVVSGALLNSATGLRTKAENATIVNLPYLLEKDEKYGGVKPKRTYYGYSYQGGFSDHLPILLKLNAAD